MKPESKNIFPQVRLTSALIFAMFFAEVFIMPCVNAQTLMLRYGFEDTGTTTTNFISGATLDIINGTTPTDFHGIAGSGVAGTGKALDFTSATYNNATSPLAFVTNSSDLGFGVVTNFTMTQWIKPDALAQFPRCFVIGTNTVTVETLANSFGYLLNNGTSFQIYLNGIQRINGGVVPSLAAGSWSFIAITYNGTNLNLYAGSQSSAVALVTTVAVPGVVINLGNSGSIFLGNRGDRLRAFDGMIDDTRFYLGAADATFLEAVRQSVLPDPNVSGTTITPTSNPIYAGSPVTLSAIYGGTAPFTSFVWQSDGQSGGVTWTNLPSSVTNSYALNTTSLTPGTYQFRLVITGAAGSATNTPASKTFVAASGPIIVANTTVVPSVAAVGNTVTVSATFNGTQPITYQWRFTDTNNVTVIIPGATSNVLTIASAQFTNAGSYSLIASNNPGGVPSVLTNTPATLTVTPMIQAAIVSLGTAEPVPGAFDIAQLNTNGNVKFPDGLNYYDNNTGGNGPAGQTFTTGTDAAGYAVNGLYLKYGGIEGNHAANLAYTLRFYSMSGSVATLLATCQNTNPSPAIANGDWILWSGLANIVLQPTTTYAYSLFVSQGFEQMGNASNSPSFYAGGEIALIPAVGGVVTFGASHAYDATFLLDLLLLGAPSVNTTPTNITFAASSSQLALSWPVDHTGWRLQSQTNALSVGLRTNWTDVVGATATNQVIIPINPANGSVFFRLVYP